MSDAEKAATTEEEEMKRRKDKSITEEIEALGDLEAYAGSIASSPDMKIDPELFLTHVSNIRSAISVHKNRSEDYIRRLELKV
jgi:hypothetical protein